MLFLHFLPDDRCKRLLEVSPLFQLLKEVELQLRGWASKAGLLEQGLSGKLGYFNPGILEMFGTMYKQMNPTGIQHNVCFVFRWQRSEIHWCPRCSMGMWGRADPFEPVSPQPQRVPGLPTWIVSDGYTAQPETGWYLFHSNRKHPIMFFTVKVMNGILTKNKLLITFVFWRWFICNETHSHSLIIYGRIKIIILLKD